MNQFRATRALINLDAIKHNYAVLSSRLRQGKIMPVIKANAYGHGAVSVATCLHHDADAFAVALVEEALELRQHGVTQDIVILEGVYSQTAFDVCYQHDLTPVLHCEHQVDLYADRADQQRPKVWLKYDIGMHRLGFADTEIADVWKKVAPLAPSQPVLCGHFSSADDESSPSNELQLRRFNRALETLHCEGSLANSPAILLSPQSHVSWNRAGIALYGLSPSNAENRPAKLQPAMTLTAPVIAVREIAQGESVGYGDTWVATRPSKIATIAIGYADGYPRHAPSGTPVWVSNTTAPLVGRVSMDMITVDITDCPTPRVGDDVELWGNHIAVEEIARWCGTIAYELVTRVGPRVPRQYISEDQN